MKGTRIAILLLCAAIGGPAAADSKREAADTAKAFVYGRESGYEPLLEVITDPDAYGAMADKRAESKRAPNENVDVDRVDVIDLGDGEAVARTTYSTKNRSGSTTEDVYLKQTDDGWKVTTPPDDAP